MLSGNYLVEIYQSDDKKIVNIKLMENTCWDWQQIWSGFSRAYWLPNWYWAFDRVTPYKSCVYMLSTQNKWWAGVLLQSTHSGSSLLLTSKQYGLGWRPQELFSPPWLYHFVIPRSLNQALFSPFLCSNQGNIQEWVSRAEGKSKLGAHWCCRWNPGPQWTTSDTFSGSPTCCCRRCSFTC